MEQPKDVIICPICQHKNSLDAKRCAQCGLALTGSTTTMRVSDEKVEQVLGDLSYQPPVHREGAAEGLVFYVAGEVQPLTVRGYDDIVLGRYVDEGQPPADLLDLSAYHGHLLGVSRGHARIRIEGDECLLEDLNSTNGTWLNEKRLTPNAPYIVNNGDQIRLGQLILFVYFSSTSSRQKVTLKPSLTATAVLPTPESMTLQLAEQVTDYLQALRGLQVAIDGIQLREGGPHSIASLSIDGDEATVEANLVGFEDAVSVIQQIIVPWQKQFSGLLTTLWSGEPQESDSPTLPVAAPDAPSSNGGPAVPAVDANLATSDLAKPEVAEQAALEDSTDKPAQTDESVPADEPAPTDEAVTADAPVPADEPVVAEEAASSALHGAIGETMETDFGLSVDELDQNLLAVVLNHVKLGLAATNVEDETYFDLLRDPVQALSRSPLELVSSSY